MQPKIKDVALRLFAVVVVAVLSLAVTGCGGDVEGDDTPVKPPDFEVSPDVGKAAKLVPFNGCGELKIEVRNILTADLETAIKSVEDMCSIKYDDFGDGGTESPPTAEPAQTGGTQAAEQSGPSVTGTNIQEKGVDEDDLIKNDGEFTYAVIGQKIKIVRVWPFSSFGEVASIEVASAPKGLFIAGKKLIVISQKSISYGYGGCGGQFGCALALSVDIGGGVESEGENAVMIEMFDISDPSSPAKISEKKYPGSLVASRVINTNLHLVISGSLNLPDISRSVYDVLQNGCRGMDNKELKAKLSEVKEKISKQIEEIVLGSIIPAAGNDDDEFCGNTYRSEAAPGRETLTVLTANIENDGKTEGTSTILGTGGSVYVSKESLIIGMPWAPQYCGSCAEQTVSEATIFHRFTLNEKPEYFGSRAISGHLLDNSYVGSNHSSRFSMAQFAMSEFEGNLRVATTVGFVSGGQSGSTSIVAVIDAGSHDMAVKGALKNFGTNERIYSVRFADNKAYVVTFKKTDPLFVIDLSDSSNPAIAGELKIPGFSTYLHPVGDGSLIGLGFDADDKGGFAWVQGLKLSLFDVSDMGNPKEVNNLKIGARGSYSTAVEEHHAFTFDSERGIIALPVEVTAGEWGGSRRGEFAYAGVLLIKVDEKVGFAEAGKIVIDTEEKNDYSYERAEVKRTAIIGDGKEEGVITLTTDALQLNKMDEAMTKVGSVK